jgi:HEPN domain-containing protein
MSDAEASRVQWTDAAEWFAKADEDIRATTLLLAANPPLVGLAAFHCQQSAEKLLEALLVAAAVKMPRIHDLEVLAASARPFYPQLAQRMADVTPAAAWIARTRYPSGLTEGAGTQAHEVADMVAFVKALRQEAAALAPFPL